MYLSAPNVSNVVSSVMKYLRCAFWCLIAVAIIEIISSFLWARSLIRPGLNFFDTYVHAVLPIFSMSLIPTVVSAPIVYSLSKSLLHAALRGDVNVVIRCRKIMAILGGITLLSLIAPGILLIIAFFKSEPLELTLLSRRTTPPPPVPPSYLPG